MKWWFAFLSVAVPSFSGAIYSVTDLGALGGASAAAFGVNAAGDSAGWADTPQGDTEAVVVTGGVFRSLGPGSEAYAINNAGQAVGLVGTHGALWTASAMTDLGAGAVAMAINNTGQIAGGNGHAFLMGAGSLQDLGTLGGGSWSAAYGLNDAGEVVGSAMLSTGHFAGFTWTAQTGMIALGTLGGADSHATSVNDLGQAAGSAALASGYQHAVIYSQGQTLDLGSLGGANSYAYSINDSGVAVGYTDVSGSGDTHAFVYQSGVMIDLNSLIPPDSGWELLAAYGINSSGEIVGSGRYLGHGAMFRLDAAPGITATAPLFESATPGSASSATPEPAAGALLLAGLAVLAVLRKPARP
jgi:probable HAF family extracellular repeat protein